MLQFKDRQEMQQIYVVKGLRNNLLELPVVEKLGLVVQVNTMTGDYNANIKH